ncbi:nicotinate-nicotinamide nucleotide adenylyltransferase, partial [Salmonella sp. SAL4358]|uniref:nicotinate-nicotinamide nucleotide adenylyltransferase n=1 Tax=Salmonella sp. SAL4358 TaxID=3159879 RepID=UPI003979864E
APAEQRVEMLELAIAGHTTFSVCRHEVGRGGVCYTVDTLAELRQQDPNRELFFLMGADSLRDLPTWKEPARLCELAQLVIVQR